MKTTFKAKVVFESDYFKDPVYTGIDDPHPELTYVKMANVINSGLADFRIVMDYYTKESEPTILIKERRESK